MSTSDGGVTSKVEATMARVRAAVPSSSDTSTRSVPGRFRANEGYLFPEDLYRSLHQARTIGSGIAVDYVLGWRTPIVGQVWMLVRRRIHQEIRIYIDGLTTQQSNLNTHLIRALTQVVETLDSLGLAVLKRRQQDQEESIAALQSEVEALRAQVEALQTRLDVATGLSVREADPVHGSAGILPANSVASGQDARAPMEDLPIEGHNPAVEGH